jgi:hypothetical protein
MLPVFWLVASLENILNAVELFALDERGLSTRVKFSLPDKRTGLERILKQAVEITFGQSLSKFRSQYLAQPRQGIVPSRVRCQRARKS